MKTKTFFLSMLCLCIIQLSYAQYVGINTTNPTNMLHIYGSSNPLRLEGTQDEISDKINAMNSPIATSEIVVIDGDGVLKKVAPENIDTESYSVLSEMLKTDEQATTAGDYYGEQIIIIPPEYDGFIVESVTYRVQESATNFTASLQKNTNGVETDLGLPSGTMGSTLVRSISGGSTTVATGDVLYLKFTITTAPSTVVNFGSVIRLVKP